MVKRIEFVGGALDELRSFPDNARRRSGFQLDRVQRGLTPDDWKPMTSIGTGAYEIRVREEGSAFRVIYVSKFEDAVFVLHCFHKKTQKTASIDIEIARMRYNEIRKKHS